MKKITASLNINSIQKAIKQLNEIKKELNSTMLYDFLARCCDWFIKRANEHLSNSDIVKSVIIDIQNHWAQPLFTNTNNKLTATITNNSDKAVFVEFGVGSIGARIPHPEASETGYEYNVPSSAKRQGYWTFYADDWEDVDMHSGYLVKPAGSGHSVSITGDSPSSGGYWITTKGSWGELYAYQALVDMESSGILKTLWKETKKKYWR